jgi:hypothetical protein
MYWIALAGPGAGDYQVILAVRDELDLKAVELREPVTVVQGVEIAPLSLPLKINFSAGYTLGTRTVFSRTGAFTDQVASRLRGALETFSGHPTA